MLQSKQFTGLLVLIQLYKQNLLDILFHYLPKLYIGFNLQKCISGCLLFYGYDRNGNASWSHFSDMAQKRKKILLEISHLLTFSIFALSLCLELILLYKEIFKGTFIN